MIWILLAVVIGITSGNNKPKEQEEVRKEEIVREVAQDTNK